MTQQHTSEPVGLVQGVDPASPLTFWVAVSPDSYLQLDDAVLIDSEVPGRGRVRISGIVQDVRAQHEGASLASDVFLADQDVLPVQTAVDAQVVVTRVSPEIFVPPMPGLPAFRARGGERDEVLGFSTIERRLPAGLSRDGEPIWLDLDFLDGKKGAHINISGISGVATKTSYALFLLYALFHSDALGPTATNAKALIFNVKGEDLLWLDHPTNSASFDPTQYEALGLKPGPFESVGLWAPARRGSGDTVLPAVSGRQRGVTAYGWTVRQFVEDRLLRFLFAEANDANSQIGDLVARIETALERGLRPPTEDASSMVTEEGVVIGSLRDLVAHIEARLDAEDPAYLGRIAPGTASAFIRRLNGVVPEVEQLILDSSVEHPERYQIDFDGAQVTVVDIHNLKDRAKRFVTGVVVRRMFEAKEDTGEREPLNFLVLDELNRYAPREGWSPIKEILLDIAERGRSMGMILIGAEQTASEVERRIVANSAFRVVGRLDAAESARSEYAFLPAVTRARASILEPGSMVLQQPTIPIPLQLRFPFPAWATRKEEALIETDDEELFKRAGGR
ncbi:MAG: ATP-binding protein [Actinomycetota bacterium]